MASLISNEGSVSDSSMESNRKKRRKIGTETESSCKSAPAVKWRSPSAQRIYAIKLVQALHRARETASPKASSVRDVRHVADRVLAMSAKGATRWSRAILANRIRLSRLRKHKKVKPPSRLRKPAAVGNGHRKKLPTVEKKVKILSRLVPGCRGLPMTNLLEEAGDYIAALEMQIRAMTALTEFLAGAQSDRLGSAHLLPAEGRR